MDKYLIINADDFGMCHAHNLATFDLFQKGGITSATIMTPCPWAFEAVKFAKNNPQFAIGVHWTLTSEWGTYRWRPISDGGSLRDSEGFMWHESDQVEENADSDEIEAEIIAQIEFLKNLGLDPSHVDNHMGSIYGIETGRMELLNIAIDVAGRYGFPFRFPGRILDMLDSATENQMLDIKIDKATIAMFAKKFTDYAESRGVALPDFLIPNDWNGPQKESYDNFREYMYEFYRALPNGVTETYMHPALESEELKAICGSWERRTWEHRLLADPATRQHIESCGIQLINYRDLKKMRN